MITSTPVAGESLNLVALLGEVDQENGQIQKDAKYSRMIHHQKKMGFLEESIGEMEEQKDLIGKNATFNFVIGMVSQFCTMMTQVISFAFPPSAPIANLVNTTAQGFLTGLKAMKEDPTAQMDSQIDQKQFETQAEHEGYYEGIADEEVKNLTAHRATVNGRLEQALHDMQKSQEATLRV